MVGYHFKNGQISLYPGLKLINFNDKNIDRNNKQAFSQKNNTQFGRYNNKSFVRYCVHEHYSTSLSNDITGNGLYSLVAWEMNLDRVSCYNNINFFPCNYSVNPLPFWEYKLPEQNMGNRNSVSSSSSGDYVVASDFDFFIFLFNGLNGSLIWNYQIPYTFYQTSTVAITNSGNFIICALNNRYPNIPEAKYLLGFNKDSNIPIWLTEIPIDSSVNIQYQGISGIRISGNDSLAIVSNYYKFFIINVSTGEMIYWNWNNPYYHNNNGFGWSQGISGDGSILAIANYYGYVRIYKWNGNTYEYLWEDQEPPGERYNWINCVDVSEDGSMVAAGTLNFIDYQNYIYCGKVKFYRVYSGNNPIWTHTDSCEGVNDVSFSKNGKILCAATGGKYGDPSLPNLLVFKTTANINIPIFAVSDSGSFLRCSISDDGTTVIGSGDKVHVNHFGMGGMYYNLSIDTSAEPIGIIANEKNVPEKFYLSQNYPNPFNPKTIIHYQLPINNYVKLTIFDALGREIGTLVNEKQSAGSYNVEWDGTNYSSGLYFYKIECDGFTDVKKMILIK